jgi:hypothetical protein
MPNQGTHAEAMLVAVAQAYPDTSWNPKYSRMKGHSRVSDLRAYGWSIEAVSRPNPYGKGSQWGYRMLTHRKHWPRSLKTLLERTPSDASQTELEVVA